MAVRLGFTESVTPCLTKIFNDSLFLVTGFVMLTVIKGKL